MATKKYKIAKPVYFICKGIDLTKTKNFGKSLNDKNNKGNK